MSANITFEIAFCLECTFCYDETFTKLNSPVLNLDYYFWKDMIDSQNIIINIINIIIIIIITAIIITVIIITAIIITAM